MNITKLALSRYRFLFVFLIGLMFLTSCITNRELEYFASKSNDELVSYKDFEYRLQVNDLLSIQISSVTEDKYDFFNKEQTANSQLMVYNPYLYGYIIGKDSALELPMVGKIYAVGKTLRELEKQIQESAITYFKDPVVKVNVMNFNVNVLGEVKNPNRYRLTDPSVNIFDVIATAGDITEFGNRRKVKVIRLTDKDPRVFYLDLREKHTASNTDFFLQPNDIIYVSPTNKRFYAFKNLPSVISIGISTVTLFLLIQRNQ